MNTEKEKKIIKQNTLEDELKVMLGSFTVAMQTRGKQLVMFSYVDFFSGSFLYCHPI